MNLSILKKTNTTVTNNKYVSDANILIYNKKQILNFINLYNLLEQALKLKHIYIEKIAFYLINKNLIINTHIYYSSIKLTSLKKKTKLGFINSNFKDKIFSNNKLFPAKFIKQNSLNNVIISFSNINTNINHQKALNLYKVLKHSIITLLKKKRYLIIDLIRVSTLLIDSKTNIKLFTTFIGQIFATLSKKSHNRFFLILKKLFHIIIKEKPTTTDISKIQGIKVKMGGRLRGKPRSDIKTITVGTVPLQSNSKHIEYFKQCIFTIYGTFGLKLWLYRN